MVEVIHEHDASSGSNNMGLVFGLIFAVALVFFLFYVFGRGFLNGGNMQPQVNIPDKINVDVKQPAN